MRNVLYTRPTIREMLKTISVRNVDFTLNSEGEYVLTVQGESIQTDQAKATYMALVGLEMGYQIGRREHSGKISLKNTKLAKRYKEVCQEARDLREENEKLLSKQRQTEMVKHQFQEKLENDREKCKHYFMYLYINGYLCFTDRKKWANDLMSQIGQGWSTKMLPLNGVASILVSEYWDELWKYI